MGIWDVGLAWGCSMDTAESKKTYFCVFQKQKLTKKKLQSIACSLKKSKSCQVNILILDFYLLELSNYKKKQNKKQKIDEIVCPQIEKKVQEPLSQLL